MNRRHALGALLAALITAPAAVAIRASGQVRIWRVVSLTGNSKQTVLG